MRYGEWVVPALVVGGLLASPLYRTDGLLVWIGPEPPRHAALAVLLVLLAFATWTLLRRDHVWTDPARLTWDDQADRDRPLLKRLVLGWALRFGAVAYAAVAVAHTVGWADLRDMAALFGVTAVFALVRALGPANRPLELGACLLLACLGAFFAGPVPVWPAIVLLWVLTLVSLRRSPPAGRVELVRGWSARLLRSVSVAFGDLVALLPPARPVRLRQGGAIRFVLAGVGGRRAAAPAALLLALVAPVLYRVFPVVPPVWWAGVGAYLAALPFAGALADAHRVPGLRRWLPAGTAALRMSTAAAVLIVAALWIAAAVPLGLPATPLVLPVVAWAIVCTVTRPPIDYAVQGALDVAGAYLPVGLVLQIVRGPDLLVLGLAALAVLT